MPGSSPGPVATIHRGAPEEARLPAKPTPAEIRAFAETLDPHAIAKELQGLKYHLDHAGDITGANSRNAALASVLGVIDFLRAIPQLGYELVPPPALTALHIALADLDDGKVAALLKPEKPRGQPVLTEARLLWGCAAAAMNCLMLSGFRKDEAGTIVARELQKLGVPFGDRRAAPVGKSISNWRDRAMGGNPETVVDAEIYRDLCGMFKSSGNRDIDRQVVLDLLAASLRNLGAPKIYLSPHSS